MEKKEIKIPTEKRFEKSVRAFSIPIESDRNIFVIESKTKFAKPRGNILIMPPYAINSHELFLFSFYLTENGFNVIRFDGINNVGLSSGTIENFTLGQLEKDLRVVIDCLLDESDLPLILVTQSISFPVALKYSCWGRPISKLISVVGVVNVKDTIERTAETSLDPYMNGADHRPREQPTHLNIFGHATMAQGFVDDMIEGELTHLDHTLAYFRKTQVPVFMVVGANDEYVNFEEIQKCRDFVETRGKLVVHSNLNHMIARSLFVVKKMALLTVELAIGGDPQESLICPKLTEAIKTASVEAEFINQCEPIFSSR